MKRRLLRTVLVWVLLLSMTFGNVATVLAADVSDTSQTETMELYESDEVEGSVQETEIQSESTEMSLEDTSTSDDENVVLDESSDDAGMNAMAATSAAEIASNLMDYEMEESSGTLTYPQVPEGYSISISEVKTDWGGRNVLATDGTITPPRTATKVKVKFQVVSTSDASDKATSKYITIKIPEKDRTGEESIGEVTISIVDKGVRVDSEMSSPVYKDEYKTAFGTIVAPTKVKIYKGDSIADVTRRLLDEQGLDLDFTGDGVESFYLSKILNLDTSVFPADNLGEKQAGSGSGWMISWNDWFVNQGTQAFFPEDGDIVEWQYTCQLGKDIGCDFDNKTAEIESINIAEGGALTQEYSKNVTEYNLNLSKGATAVKLRAVPENKWAKVTYRVDGKEYKVLSEIPVQDGTVIDINCSFWNNFDDPEPAASKTITIHVAEINEDCLLSALSFSGRELTPEFAEGQLIYTLPDLSYSVSNVNVKATAKTEGATIKAYYTKRDGSEAEVTIQSGKSSFTSLPNLKVGNNAIRFVVTSPTDPQVSNTYWVNVVRSGALSTLSVKANDQSLTLDPAFAANKYE